MLVELWHHWALLRALFVLTLAAPLFIAAAVFRGRSRPGDSEKPSHDQAAPPSDAEVGLAHRLEASPRQWPGGGAGPDRRAA
jgi:hypothetical protein